MARCVLSRFNPSQRKKSKLATFGQSFVGLLLGKMDDCFSTWYEICVQRSIRSAQLILRPASFSTLSHCRTYPDPTGMPASHRIFFRAPPLPVARRFFSARVPQNFFGPTPVTKNLGDVYFATRKVGEAPRPPPPIFSAAVPRNFFEPSRTDGKSAGRKFCNMIRTKGHSTARIGGVNDHLFSHGILTEIL